MKYWRRHLQIEHPQSDLSYDLSDQYVSDIAGGGYNGMHQVFPGDIAQIVVALFFHLRLVYDAELNAQNH